MTFGNNLLESNKSRILGLDILRSIAILLVVYEHGNFILPLGITKYFPQPPVDGVAIFFVLSGYLIGGILLKIIRKSSYTTTDIINFWIRRWFRTLPNYFLIVGFLLFYQLILYKNVGKFNFQYLIFFQNFYQPHPNFFAEAWSLCVEEWFYLLFPILTYILYKTLKKKNKSIIIAAIIFLIIPLLLRIIKYYFQIGIDDCDLNFRKIVILRLDSLMYGIIGAYIFSFKQDFWIKIKNKAMIVSLLIIAFLTMCLNFGIKDQIFFTIFSYNLESIATLCALPFFSQLKTIKNKNVTLVFTYISVISYSMYVLNFSVIQNRVLPHIVKYFCLWTGINPGPSTFIYIFQYLMYWFLTIYISYLLYKYFESPIMNLRDRIVIKNK